MKQLKTPVKPPSPPGPLNPQQFPLQAQTDATASREKVREVVPVHAPRESKRPVERSDKGRAGS